MDALEKALPFSEKMKNSVLLLDGYTGFYAYSDACCGRTSCCL